MDALGNNAGLSLCSAYRIYSWLCTHAQKDIQLGGVVLCAYCGCLTSKRYTRLGGDPHLGE